MKNTGIGSALRSLRIMAGVTRARVSELTGVTEGSIGRIERGAPSTTRTINRIASALGYEAHVTFRKKDGDCHVIAEMEDQRQQKLFDSDLGG